MSGRLCEDCLVVHCIACKRANPRHGVTVFACDRRAVCRELALDVFIRQGERKVESFDAAFAPLRNLTADDVVVGCSAHGADFMGESCDH